MLIMKVILLSLYEIIAQKATWTLSTMITLLMSFFLPIETYIFCSFLAVFADFICGWAAAANRGEGFQGKKIRETFVKLLLYVTVTASFYHISRSLCFPFDITYFVVSMISVAEMMSILRNVGDYTGYDYEGKIREVFPKLADFLPKSKNIATIVFWLSSYCLSAQSGQIPIPIRVDLAPVQSTPTDANTEFYTQKGGTAVKRVPFGILQKSIAPLALPTTVLSYIPTATANPIQDRGRIVRGSNQNVYYIDWEGRGIQLVSSGAQSTYTAGSGLSLANNQFVNTGDLSNTNEIQSLTKTGNLIQLSQGGGSVFDSDNQSLSISGTTLSLSNGGSVTLPSGTTYTAGVGVAISVANTISATDSSATNEIQTLSLTGTTLNLSKGGGAVTLPSGGGGTYTAGSGIGISTANVITADDNSATNEIQTLSQAGQIVTLSKLGGSFTLPTVPTTIDASATDVVEVPSPNNQNGRFLTANANGTALEYSLLSPLNTVNGNQISYNQGVTSIQNLPHPIAGTNTTVSPKNAQNGWAVNVTGVDVSATDLYEIPNPTPNTNGQVLGFLNNNTPPTVGWVTQYNGLSAGTGISFGSGSIVTNTGDLSNTNEAQTISVSSVPLGSGTQKRIKLSDVGSVVGGTVDIEDRKITSISSSNTMANLSLTIQDSGGGAITNASTSTIPAAASGTHFLGGTATGAISRIPVASIIPAITVENSLNTTNQLITKVNGVPSTPITLPIADNWGTQVVSHGQTLEGDGATTPLGLVDYGTSGSFNWGDVDAKGRVNNGKNVAISSLYSSGTLKSSYSNRIVPYGGVLYTGVYEVAQIMAEPDASKFEIFIRCAGIFEVTLGGTNLKVNGLPISNISNFSTSVYITGDFIAGANVYLKIKVLSVTGGDGGLTYEVSKLY